MTVHGQWLPPTEDRFQSLWLLKGRRYLTDKVPTAGDPSPAGQREAVRLLYGLGRLYAAGIRAVTTPVVVVIALLAASVETMTITAVVMAIVSGWSVVYVRGLLRGSTQWITVVDATVLVVLCLSTRWTVPSDWLAGGESWVMAFVSFAFVAYQVHTGLGLELVSCG
jgi:hypothetical protein